MTTPAVLARVAEAMEALVLQGRATLTPGQALTLADGTTVPIASGV